MSVNEREQQALYDEQMKIKQANGSAEHVWGKCCNEEKKTQKPPDAARLQRKGSALFAFAHVLILLCKYSGGYVVSSQ